MEDAARFVELVFIQQFIHQDYACFAASVGCMACVNAPLPHATFDFVLLVVLLLVSLVIFLFCLESSRFWTSCTFVTLCVWPCLAGTYGGGVRVPLSARIRVW